MGHFYLSENDQCRYGLGGGLGVLDVEHGLHADLGADDGGAGAFPGLRAEAAEAAGAT